MGSFSIKNLYFNLVRPNAPSQSHIVRITRIRCPNGFFMSLSVCVEIFLVV